jgi:hypothetical protein
MSNPTLLTTQELMDAIEPYIMNGKHDNLNTQHNNNILVQVVSFHDPRGSCLAAKTPGVIFIFVKGDIQWQR